MMITVVVAITDQKIYEECTGGSLARQKTPYKLIKTDVSLPLTESYLQAVPKKPQTKYLLFIHQDFKFLEEGHWLEKAEKFCDTLPNLGAAGIAGWQSGSSKVIGFFVARYGNRSYGMVDYFGNKYRGKIKGSPFSEAIKVQVLDDMCIIIPTEVWKKQKFDKRFAFHLNGQDYSLALKYNLGLDCYVLPLKTYENSVTSYVRGYREKHGDLKSWIPLLGTKWGKKTKYAGGYEIA